MDTRDHAPTRSPSSTTRWPPCASATCIAPLRVMSSAQGPIVSIDDRRVISLSSNDYLGPDPPPAAERGGARRRARVRRRARAPCARSPGTMTDARGARGGARRVQGHTEAVLTFQSGFTANTGVIPTITGETDLIVCDELNHASIIDGMRLSKAPRKIYPHADVDALREVLDEAVEQGPGRHGRAVPADPRRHRRRVQHGRRHRAAARDRRGGRGVRRGGHGRRRPCLRRPGSGRPRDGRPLRSARPRRDPGRDAVQGRRCARRLRGGVAGPARHPHPAGPPVPVLDQPPAGRRRRLPRGDRDHAGGAGAASSGCGRTPAASRRS